MPHTAPARARSAFTLLEVIVVIAIIAVLASLAAPRFSGTARRTFDLTADQVADLLVVFAQRDTLGHKPVGIQYDSDRRALMLVSLNTAEGGYSEWVEDRFVGAVRLPDVIDEDRLVVTADGEWIDIRDYPLHHTPGEDRPSIEVVLASIDGAHQTSIVLGSHDVSPRRAGRNDLLTALRPVDLDSAGRSREDW